MRRLFAAAGLVALFLSPAQADFGEYISHELDSQTLIVQTDKGELRVSAIDDAAFEVHYIEPGVKQLPSFAIAAAGPAVSLALAESEQTLTLATAGLVALINKSPVRIDYTSHGTPLFSEEQGYFADDAARGFRFKLDAGEKILGGGERVLGMDRRGHRMPLYNRAHYGYETESNQMYYSVPAILSSDKYMIVFDNSASGWLDIGATEDDVLQFEAVGGRTSYIAIAGENYPALIKNYTDVTGRQPLPPRWAFGNFASRFGYHTEKEVRRVVRRYKRFDIPLDAVILDLYWYGPDIKGHVGNLDWDRNAFPTAEKMISDFAQQGIKTIPITQPFVLSTSKRWQEAVDNKVLAKNADGDPRRFDFYFGNTGLIDVFDESARTWFWKAYARLFDQGAVGTWGDLGEPEVHPDDTVHWLSDVGVEARGDEVHNVFGHVWAKMVYENRIKHDPDIRPMILMRSGFAGSQRYGVIPWTGDVSRSWDGLRPQVELSLQMGLFGLAYTHSDLGGFAGGEKFDREMYIRWLQYGVFQPVYRPHGQEHIPSEPVFHDRKTRRIVRDFIKLRYRLLPYNYTLAYQNSTTGMPLMRPLFFEDETDPSLIDEKYAYLWGDAFLVAPVLDAGVESVDVKLPEGVWFDFWNDTRYEGGTTASVPVTLETIPVLVRGGSFVPMSGDIDTTRDYSSKELALHYYADASVAASSGQMYDDDGKSRRSLDEEQFEILKFRSQHDGDSLTIELTRDGQGYPGRPDDRTLTLVIHNWTGEVNKVRFGGEAISIERRAPKRGTGAWYDRDDQQLFVRIDWDHSASKLEINPPEPSSKPVIYQVFTRLFGNKNSTNKPWGTIEENGVGKFDDFTDAALAGIRELGVTHVWYTGVPHHALIRDYTEYGISNDDPDVVKGRAGSPYSVKDYYNVNPDLALDPAQRLEEFDALVDRTHAHDMKVIIDIVPNHVARSYQSVSNPDGVEDFGANDDTSVEWSRDNNFYYVVGQEFQVPEFPDRYRPLGGEQHPAADGDFSESPAKWTGNGARVAQPNFQDWYEAVKINHGVRPDGSYAFDRLPETARGWSVAEHAAFWTNKDVPDSWKKFRDIVLYWTAKKVDGFRYDMAEMVPVEFWSYLNSSVKTANPDAILIAEVYNPDLYRNYIQLGLMDYLYDKVGLYDTLKPVMQGEASADTIAPVHASVLDISQHMLHFLENHDEERIASSNFAGDAAIGKPAMVVSALISGSPTLLYFGQEVGESGDHNDALFNRPMKMRTTQYDYWGVSTHQRWMNGGKFDGGGLDDAQKELRDFYSRLLTFSASNKALQGQYAEIHSYNRKHGDRYDDRLFSFVRWLNAERLIVISNFDDTTSHDFALQIPANIISAWRLADGRYALGEQLYGENNGTLLVAGGVGHVTMHLDALESAVLKLQSRISHD